MMRVLHIGKHFAPSQGGMETFLLDLCKRSHAMGVTQGVLVHATDSRSNNAGDLNEFPFLTFLDRVPTWGALAYAPISPSFVWRLRRAIRNFKPDVLHFHLPNPSAFWVLALHSARRLPWVIHWHADAAGVGYEAQVRHLYPVYRLFEQALLRRASSIVVTSPPYLKASQALRDWQAKCHVIPLAIDTARLATADGSEAHACWRRDGALRVLAVGRLTAYKGFDGLIEAAAQTRAEVIIVGEGSERGRLQAMIEDRTLHERVRLVGAMDDRHRNAWLQSCDVLCLPSLNRAEAFGISVLEAMAAGKPAVVSKIEGSGLPWLVEHNQTGWHVQPGDPVALAECLNRLDRERDELIRCGQQAAQRHHQNFSLDSVTQRVIQLQKHTI